MSSHSTSLEPKILTYHNPYPQKKKKGERRKENSQSKSGRKRKKEKKKKKRKENSQSTSGRKQKRRRRKDSWSRIERKQKKYAERSLDQKISEQYRIVTKKKKKKGNHNLKWSSPFDCQPKSCASMTCSPRAKQKQKRKRPKTHKSQKSHQRNPFPREVLLIHDHACNLWFNRKWFAKSSHDISMVWN